MRGRCFSCYHHSLLVSYASFVLCRRLGWRAKEAARGALLHDLYLYDWTDRSLHTGRDHLKNHPATALENAIRACMELPEPARIIRCRVIRHPGLMFVISNPCAGVVCFDEHGLPRSDGHGLGTRSISAFCKKYGALCRYEWAEGWFFLRVIF